MIIDGHSHVYDPLDIHLSALDDAGVDRTVLFPTRPHPERATDLVSLRHEMSVLGRALAGSSTDGSGAGGDDGYAKAWRELDAALAAQPTRFLGFGAVPLGRTADEIAAWVEREVVGRGLYGIGEQFRLGQVVTGSRAVQRPTGRPAPRWDEYGLLRDRVRSWLGGYPGR
ncbi:hypothetical protein [Streptomyces rimosus]|uniref:hypothetical protein n=1 Tax=Streptomyces rimosus TaxID=1927 RepID=UPI000AE203B0|nr:hypothetical protein [Streptomyces rimosus]